MTCSHTGCSLGLRDVLVQIALDTTEKSDLTFAEPVLRQFGLDKKEAASPVNYKKVGSVSASVSQTNEGCRFRAENLDSFSVTSTIIVFAPVMAENLIAEVKVTDAGEQFAEAVPLSLEGRSLHGILFRRGFDFEIGLKYRTVAVLFLPSAKEKSVQVELLVLLRKGDNSRNHGSLKSWARCVFRSAHEGRA